MLEAKQLEIFEMAVFITEICWIMVIWMVKYSILAAYWRLFSVNRRSVRIVIWTLTVLVTCWGVIVVRFIPRYSITGFMTTPPGFLTII